VLHDAVFDFLAETATEVTTRIRLQENTRTVAKGALWYEENLPAESVLWGIIAVDRSWRTNVKKTGTELLNLLPKEERLQIGSNATVGRGQVRWLLSA
jgi:CRISPR-associated protein Cmr4